MARMRILWALAAALLILGVGGCGSGGGSDSGSSAGGEGLSSASLVGRVVDMGSRSAARSLAATADGTCPEIAVTVNGAPADVEVGSDCGLFIVPNLPSGEVQIVITVDGTTATLDLTVVEGEVIEVEVQAEDGTLSIFVLREAVPEPGPLLPEVIDEDDVAIDLPAGLYDQTLTVNGDRFTLTGESGATCDDAEGWTAISGEVVVNGDHAIFRNVMFLGPVRVTGDDVVFSNVCLGDDLIVVGDGSSVPGDDDSGDRACLEVLDFESLPGISVGGTVEGAGAVHPFLDIGTRREDAENSVVLVAEGMEPTVYTSPNSLDEPISNGCLGNPGGFFATDGAVIGSVYGQGFADLDGVHDYVFTVLEGRSVRHFSVSMLDFGDVNETGATAHTVRLIAYRFAPELDSFVQVDEDVLSYDSDGQEHPVSSTAGDLFQTGDACVAQPGEPGNRTFTVHGEGITRIEFVVDEGPDAGIALDNIVFELEQVDVKIDVLPTINLKSNGVIPVAIFGNACLDVGEIDVSTVFFGPDGAPIAHPQAFHGPEGDHFAPMNGDARGDLVLHFRTQETGIGAGDTEACLEGATVDGRTFRDCDGIRIVPSKEK